MKTKPLKNYSSSVGVEAYDIDWNSPEEVLELGKLAAGQCIVFINDAPDTTVLSKVMHDWGDPAGGLVNGMVSKGVLKGRHWRDFYATIARTVYDLPDELHKNVVRVTYRKDKKGLPTGIFAQGELDWHCDQSSIDDVQRIIGLKSVADSANSQTQFLCTHDAYESLSSDMRSMVKELYVKHKWVMGAVAPGLDLAQNLIAMYNSVPINGLETRLYSETVTGLSGLKLPTHSFDGFAGMSREESDRILAELNAAVFKDKYVYTQDWQDGQLVFMDQEITLHKRPTNITHGNNRLMNRVICYLNKIFPHKQPVKHARFEGQEISFDELLEKVDQARKEFVEHYQNGKYADTRTQLFKD
jgi:alpha-ketoglutarate-dependent taurine dioxygenase